MTAVIGTITIALMLWQHWSIHRKSKSTNWEQTLKFYSRSMQAAVLATLLFTFGCTIVLIMDLSAEGDSRVLAEVREFTVQNKGPLSVMCIAFLAVYSASVRNAPWALVQSLQTTSPTCIARSLTADAFQWNPQSEK